MTDNILVLVRHGESEWNRLNLFTGWRNPDLTEKGVIEARVAGRMIRDNGVKFDIAFTSILKRAQHTLDIILAELNQPDVPIIRDAALNERDYGELSGLNKDEARKKWGEAQVQIWRRSYDIAPPGGESLKDTLARVRPYYDQAIWPQITQSKNVVIVAHGNSLRSLVMILEGLNGDEILKRELATGAPILYRLGADGRAIDRKDLLPTRSLAAPPEDRIV
ncbi:2,3-bisphosphoglycerate-dependent phosphoglycerate mutase [Hyphomicrobium denitrificans]|uniref:2,3-bisphosphoglycerate-dependent phosphoglycerate mutase n=1 Tax=Hyphomicrobium denitrificans TaxID=53399 RepID=UPI001FCBEB2B|nr:2,3-bisphosphoglycerate-dependent phosphoglycerate mutase [Hyphomicrobium denitrificans]